MMIGELVEKLLELDQEKDIYVVGVTDELEVATELVKDQALVETENGHFIPAPVWVIK
jgi:hypothetical protein